MHALGVVGAEGVGATTTAVNLAAALRREGHHAAVLDLSGDAADLFNVATGASLADAVRGDATAADATATVDLPAGDVDDALAEYAESLGRDKTAFRAGDAAVDPGDPEPGELPIAVGGDRAILGDADHDALSDVLGDLAFAYDYLVVDAGTLDPAVAHLSDGVVVVAGPSDDSVSAARDRVADCRNSPIPVLGVVIDRATDRTDVTAVGERVDAKILAVVPDDDRPSDIEPVASTAPEAPAALAFSRLVESVVDRTTDQGDDDRSVAAGGVGGGGTTEDPGDESDGDEGLLGRLSDRFG